MSLALFYYFLLFTYIYLQIYVYILIKTPMFCMFQIKKTENWIKLISTKKNVEDILRF